MKDVAFAKAKITYDDEHEEVWLASHRGTLTLKDAKVSVFAFVE
jgi:hypothetical protein